MITLKLPYKSESMPKIDDYRRQYSLCLRYLYNRLYDSEGNISEKELRQCKPKLKNIDDIGCWLFQSAVKEAIQTYSIFKDKKIVFGTSKAFKLRLEGKMSREEFQAKRLRSVYSIGEASKHGNRLFRIEQTLDKIVFQPDRKTKIELDLPYVNPKMAKLFALQQDNKIALTYTLNGKFVCITYDEKELDNYDNNQRKGRTLALDLNPNYIGLSIVDWKSSSGYKLVYSKTFNLSKFDKHERECQLSSTDRKHWNRKKRHEMIEIAKHIVNLAIHYQCSTLAIEDLKIESGDKGKGKDFNRLCNNTWARNLLVEQLSKRANIHNVRFVKVKPEYSSFIGNLLFREESKPDPVLASIEIGRRGYELIAQYIEKTKQRKKNIVFPDKEDFRRQYCKSMEEFGILDKANLSWTGLYSYMNKTKMMYRLPLDRTKVFKFKSKHIWTCISL